jgi:hypothetical protein
MRVAKEIKSLPDFLFKLLHAGYLEVIDTWMNRATRIRKMDCGFQAIKSRIFCDLGNTQLGFYRITISLALMHFETGATHLSPARKCL